jgi:metal-responsive CopG/Arc/MetJ family transcriptional regulator
MRTTIEMRDEHRTALSALAARRGMKGFSDLVDEAITDYLNQQVTRDERTRRALRCEGGLEPEEAEDLRDGLAAARAVWRVGSR